ncbi:hypothetical protein CW304_19240 [Bacillus sp. UFRGS-B20]|nr:hypothetical protein CW304_19240 [Bacillus sp. UFRGS-B20]
MSQKVTSSLGKPFTLGIEIPNSLFQLLQLPLVLFTILIAADEEYRRCSSDWKTITAQIWV